MLAGGDDYELCFTAPRGAAARVDAIAAEAGVPLARIGTIAAAPGLVVRDERGGRSRRCRAHSIICMEAAQRGTVTRLHDTAP